MTYPFRKIIAITAVLTTAVMLYLERTSILSGEIGSIVWILVGLIVAIAAVMELMGVGEQPD